MLRFQCPRCAQEISARGKLAGKKVRCPRCQEVLTAPSAPTGIQPATNDASLMVQVVQATRPAVPSDDVIVDGVEVVNVPAATLLSQAQDTGRRPVPEMAELLCGEDVFTVRQSTIRAMGYVAGCFFSAVFLVAVGWFLPG